MIKKMNCVICNLNPKIQIEDEYYKIYCTNCNTAVQTNRIFGVAKEELVIGWNKLQKEIIDHEGYEEQVYKYRNRSSK